MKTLTLLKSLSAVGILGTALFSVNAHADCYCPTGHAIGGNNCGIPKQGGGGWQHIFPMTCTADSPTPSRSSDDWSTPKPMSPEVRQRLEKEINDTSVIAYWFDKKTQQVGYKSKPISLGDYDSVEQQFKNQCAKENRDCSVGYRIVSKGSYHASPEKCVTIYKQLVNRGGTGLFSKPKYVEIYGQSLWDTPAEKINTYKGIKERKDIPVKDVCFN